MNSNNCGICMESLTDGRPTTILCSGVDENNIEWTHIFHKECMQGWINANIGRSITCPICRREVSSINLSNLPLQFWFNINIYLDAIHLMIPAYVVRNFVIVIQRHFEFERLSAIDLDALARYAESQARVNSERRINGIPRFNTLLNSISAYAQMRLTSNAVRQHLDIMQEHIQEMIGLLILIMIFKMFRHRYYDQEGGGNNMILRIGNESIIVPPEFKNTVKEAFDSLKKTLSKSNAHGTRRRSSKRNFMRNTQTRARR